MANNYSLLPDELKL
ncbi:unnamed protein product, partial [Rotaria magnacalcarata]